MTGRAFRAAPTTPAARWSLNRDEQLAVCAEQESLLTNGRWLLFQKQMEILVRHNRSPMRPTGPSRRACNDRFRTNAAFDEIGSARVWRSLAPV